MLKTRHTRIHHQKPLDFCDLGKKFNHRNAVAADSDLH